MLKIIRIIEGKQGNTAKLNKGVNSMKTFLTIILLAALTACSDGTSHPETATSSEVVQSATVTPTITHEPVKTLFCTDKITTNCEVRFCPQGTDGCPAAPPPCRPDDASCKVLFCQPVGNCPVAVQKPAPSMPVLNVVCDENPERGCPPNGTPKKEPMPEGDWDCIVGCDTSSGV